MMTLSIVAILIAAALQLGQFTGDSVLVTRTEKDLFQAEQLAMSGIHLAEFILVEDASKNEVDTVQEAWADPGKLSQAVNELGLEAGTLTINIEDELSKIQVNALIQEFPGNQFNYDQVWIWENLLRQKFSNNTSMDGKDPARIINSVKDWLDAMDDDAITGISGAESDYYLGLDFPYTCPNGPFNHIDELLSVKGILTDFVQNDETDEMDKQGEKTDLENIFTIYGMDKEKNKNNRCSYPGRVNINTADIDVLAALLPEGMELLAEDLSDFRGQKNEEGGVFVNTLDKGWYKKVIDLPEKEKERFERIIRHSSDIFKITCAAEKNDAKVKFVAYLRREKHITSGKWTCRIIQMERK